MSFFGKFYIDINIKQNQFYKYIFYGEGDTVIYQSPNQGEKIKEGDNIMFYLG